MIYSIHDNEISGLEISFSEVSKSKKKGRNQFNKLEDIVTDIKTNPLKMQRLLISYQNTLVAVYSINKNR